jgi:cell division protein FtsZ
MENSIMNFDLPREVGTSMIKVIGVGGGGCNAVDHMYRQGIKGVDFIVCNTDQQALDKSPVPTKIILGATLTEGLGAGSNPAVGKNSAIETIDEIKTLLDKKTKMIFITAGMGGGTGTGAAPVIAGVAKEMGILTVAIVTIPFGFEGRKRKTQAEEGINELKKNVDTLLVICNDKLREIFGNLKMTDAFGHADDILTTGAKGIAEIITEKLHVNTDFADIQTVLKDSGKAIMGSAQASGENRAVQAVEKALSSPLLDDSDIKGARHVLLNVKCGSGENEVSMDEFGDITDYLQDAAGGTAEVIQGYGIDESLGNNVVVTIIATGFSNKQQHEIESVKAPQKKITPLYSTPIPTAIQTTLPVIDEPRSIEQNIIELEVENKVVDEVISNSSTEQSSTVRTEEIFTYQPDTSSYSDASSQIESSSTEIEQSGDDAIRKSVERKKRLNLFSLRHQKNLQDLEDTPAYKRKNIQLDNVPHSSDSQVSRYTLSEGEDKKAEIKPNNSFLHDNVD